MASYYGFISKFKAKPHKRDDLLQILLQAAEALRSNEDCLLYLVNSSDQQPDAIWVNEVWTSKSAHNAALKPEPVQEVIHQAMALLDGAPESTEMTVAGGKGVQEWLDLGSPAEGKWGAWPEIPGGEFPGEALPAGLQPPVSTATDGAGARRRGRRLRKILTPIVLAGIGILMGAGAFRLYSSPSALSSPSPPLVELSANFPVAHVAYEVHGASQGITEIAFEVDLPDGTASPPAGADPVLSFEPPAGTSFNTCPAASCLPISTRQYIWNQPLTFKTYNEPFSGDTYGAAIIHIYVRAQKFGEDSNHDSAEAAIPTVLYEGAHTPAFEARYDNIPAATGYDWSAFSPETTGNNFAVWDEELNRGYTNSREAVGVNHASETTESNDTFIAGILFGLAGGVIVSAVTEALRALD